MRHALVIGGSGMLAGASLWLAREGHEVSVIGRNPQKLKRLCDQHPNLHGVSADYSRAAEFAADVARSDAETGARQTSRRVDS